MFVKKVAVPVAAATTDEVASINVEGFSKVGVQLKNVGAAALDALEVWGKIAPEATEVPLLTVGADYTTPSYPCVKASASPITLAAGASAWMALDVSAFASLSIKASGAGATSLDFFSIAK